ncbi:MAG TPA: hypothetical protein VLU25_03880 [Acidobacteriota bacterium]|nr:hypothetical protein [Acidobacteriota bacterium]
MLDLRSAELKAIERGGGPGWKELARRWVLAALSVAALATLVWVIAARAVDAEGPGRVLYALHDYLYLPLRGYLWEWAYPWSLAVWVPLIFLGLLWGASYLWGRSLASGAQAFLLRRLLARPATRALLMRAARAGLPSSLLREAVACELEVAKFRLQAEGASSLAALLAELASLDQDSDLCLQAAVEWVETLAVSPGDSSRSPLEQAFQWLMLPSDKGERAQRHPFSWSALARDLRDAGAPADTFGEEEARLPEEQLRRIRLNRLGESIERRRRLLEEELRRLELERRQDRLALMARRQRPLPLPAAQLPAAGRLASALALLYSIESDQPQVALLWIDLLEGLHLALGLAPPQAQGDYALLTRGLPSAFHYRLASRLARRRHERRRAAWQAQRRRSDDLLTEADFIPSQRRLASLQLASGRE